MSTAFSRTAVDWAAVAAGLDEEGFALTGRVLAPARCKALQRGYDDGNTRYRSVVDMHRHNFGRGQYRYFDYPLPPLVQAMREFFYAGLAPIANAWAGRMQLEARWPDSLAALTKRCHAAGQTRPTPLVLRYRAGD